MSTRRARATLVLRACGVHPAMMLAQPVGKDMRLQPPKGGTVRFATGKQVVSVDDLLQADVELADAIAMAADAQANFSDSTDKKLKALQVYCRRRPPRTPRAARARSHPRQPGPAGLSLGVARVEIWRSNEAAGRRHSWQHVLLSSCGAGPCPPSAPRRRPAARGGARQRTRLRMHACARSCLPPPDPAAAREHEHIVKQPNRDPARPTLPCAPPP